MIVVDTSAWVEHLRGRTTPVPGLLEQRVALLHPSVLGELLLGGLPRRSDALPNLREIPTAPLASPAEVIALIEWANLAGTGIGYVDAHLLASARSMPEGRLLTTDQRLHAQAARLGLAFAT